MNSRNRSWNILCWNVRRINDREKWNSIHNKIDESGANIFCLQETKQEDFDLCYIRNFAPKRFDQFEFCPSNGASGGILVCWVSSSFLVNTIEKHPFALKLFYTSTHNIEN